MEAATASTAYTRWELYRSLGEPARLKILALTAEEELAIGELAELLKESQPNVSRQLKPLRRMGIVAVRKEGTRVLVHLPEGARSDPVLADALESGRALCREDGSLGRVPDVVAARDHEARRFFDAAKAPRAQALPAELPAYLSALSLLIPERSLAVDVGTGDGALLEMLAPIFDRVIAVDRAQAQLDRARERLSRRSYHHVELVEADFASEPFARRLEDEGGADVVFAARVLHHAPQPARALAAITRLCRPGGAVLLIDYAAHHDERLREQQADLWLGFEGDALGRMARRAGLSEVRAHGIPAPRCGDGPDGHLEWQVLAGRRERPSAEARGRHARSTPRRIRDGEHDR